MLGSMVPETITLMSESFTQQTLIYSFPFGGASTIDFPSGVHASFHSIGSLDGEMKKALYILAEFSDRDFDWLLAAGKKVFVSTGTRLIEEGKTSDALYLVLNGSLSVSSSAVEGQEIARLQEGEVVGEMSFVDSRLPSATVIAGEDSWVWSIPRNKLAVKLLQDVEFAAHFYQAIAVFLSDRLRETVNRLRSSGVQPPFAEPDSDLNPQLEKNIDLAKARLDWLLKRLKDTP